MAMGLYQLQCPYGTMESLVDFGINHYDKVKSKDKSQNQACLRKKALGNLEYSEKYIDAKRVKAWFDKFCKGKATCAARFQLDNKPVNEQDISLASTSTNGWIKQGSGFCKTADEKNCVQKMSKFFLQHTCTVKDDAFKDKYNKIAMVSACIMFIAFCFGALVYYMKKTSKLEQLNYDMNTITASDFTVEMDITGAQYKKFNEIRDEDQAGRFTKHSIGFDFREYIK